MLFFARRVRRGACETSVSGFFGVGASLRRWFAWASARSLRQNWRWLKLARTQKSGLRGGPKFGAALPFGN